MKKLLLIMIVIIITVSGVLAYSVVITHKSTPKYIGNGHSIITFSGYTWEVQDAPLPELPGPNSFSPNNVWVDAFGSLHLKIAKNNGVWQSASVNLSKDLGYGKYSFELHSDPSILDENVVAGLFLYQSNGKEYDIEFSKWGDKNTPPLLYSIQPSLSLNAHTPQFGGYTTHSIERLPSSLTFTSSEGSYSENRQYFASWNHTIPKENTVTSGRVNINLWLYHGKPAKEESMKEIIISSFHFTPLP